MSFKINTNTYGLYAHVRASAVNEELGSSLEKLSSGLQINKAADDASGLAIANSLKVQASGLGQAVRNANDGIGLIQIADNAMEEMTQILDIVKTKAIQSAQDGQTLDTRNALQADITKLMEEFNNIAKTTSYNGQTLLDGSFTNKEFQIGAYANQTIGVNIDAATASKLGHVRFETSDDIVGAAALAISQIQLTGLGAGGSDFQIEAVQMGTGVGEGVGAVADAINKYTSNTGVSASWSNTATGGAAVVAGAAAGITLNGITIGDVNVLANDSDGALVAAFNAVSAQTGIRASTEAGVLSLTSVDGRAIDLAGIGATGGIADNQYGGRLTLSSLDGRDIQMVDNGAAGITTANHQETVNLATIYQNITDAQSYAGGSYKNAQDARFISGKGVGVGVTSFDGAQMVMKIVDSAIKNVDRIRSDLGSTQNQMTSTINNITVTQANIKIAESQIRDVDFAEESSKFNKNKLLAQAGTYAMSQANQVASNVLKLLQ